MPRSSRSLSACATFRFEWKPSRWLLAAMIILPLLAAFALVASNLPRNAAWSAAACVVALGAWRWRGEAMRAPRTISICGECVEMDGRRVGDWRLQWRGGLAFARFRRDGKTECLSWWPDTLPARKRRELRLANAAMARVAS